MPGKIFSVNVMIPPRVVVFELRLNIQPDTFWPAYRDNKCGGVQASLEASSVIPVLKRLMEEQIAWEGTATELLKALNTQADEQDIRMEGWPKAANRLSALLKRLEPNLPAIGIEVQREHKAKARLLKLSYQNNEKESIVTTVTEEVKTSDLKYFENDDLPF